MQIQEWWRCPILLLLPRLVFVEQWRTFVKPSKRPLFLFHSICLSVFHLVNKAYRLMVNFRGTSSTYLHRFHSKSVATINGEHFAAVICINKHKLNVPFIHLLSESCCYIPSTPSAKGRQSSGQGMGIHSTALRVVALFTLIRDYYLFDEKCGVVKPLLRCYSFPYEIY